MTEDLNNFAQYATYSTYSTIFNDFKSPAKTQPLKRNPLEYYTKRNIEPPRTLHGDPTKILEPFQLQKQEQPTATITNAQIHHYAAEINNLCTYANNIFNPQQKIPPLKQKVKQPQTSTMNFEQFKELMKSNDERLTNSELEMEFNQYLRFRQEKKTQHLSPHNQPILDKKQSNHDQKIISSPQLKLDLDTSLERAKSEVRSDLAFMVPRRTVKELYQRSNKAVLTVEELTQQKQQTRPKLASLTQLGQHSDMEIQKAVQALQRQKVPE